MTDIRRPPSALTPPFTTEQLKALGQSLKWRIAADILLAVSGIEIFGQQVFAGLSVWANDLRTRADQAYASAYAAQGAADYANAQLTGIMLISDVGGGVSLTSGFDGDEDDNLGGSWTQEYDGPGGGTFGLDGESHAVWDKSGGLARRCFARHNSTLDTDYQRGRIVVTTVPQKIALGNKPGLYIVLRCNAACDTLTYARVSADEVAVGCLVSGTDTELETAAVTVSTGDTFDFYAGTDADDRQFILRRNGVDVIDHTDSGTATVGSGYRYPGLGARATSILFLSQADPGAVTAWGAIDRLATSY